MVLDKNISCCAFSAVHISAAAEGVGALTSAAKSDKDTSVSCPTAEIIGIFDLAIALTQAPCIFRSLQLKYFLSEPGEENDRTSFE